MTLSTCLACRRQGVAFDKDGTLTLPYAESVYPDLRHSLDACRAAFGGKVVLFSNSAGLFQFDPEGDVPTIASSHSLVEAMFHYTDNGDTCAGEVAARLEQELGIPVLRHAEKKPAGSAAELEAFFGCVQVCINQGICCCCTACERQHMSVLKRRPAEPSGAAPYTLLQARHMLRRCPADRLVMVGDRYLTDVVYGNKNGMLTVYCSALSTEGEPTTVRLARRIEERYVDNWRNRGIVPPVHSLVPSEELLATFTRSAVGGAGTDAQETLLAS